jgi:lipopolysaccharide transport system permease protein
MPDAAQWVITAESRSGFGVRARELWQYRRVLWLFTLKGLQALYAKTHLGVWWLFIRTLVPLAVGALVFGTVMDVPSGGVPYFVFFLTGQIAWSCFDGPLVRASRGLDVNRELLRKVYVPRMILPLGQIGSGLAEPIILMGVLLGSLVFYRVSDGVWYTAAEAHAPALIASLAIPILFAFSLSLFTSVWQARARDVRFVLRYVVSFWMYLTPVIYPVSVVPEAARWLVYLNPLTAPLETFRAAVLPQGQYAWGWFGYSAAVTAATLLAGIWYFVRSENATMDKL